ncbi:MAG: SbmA/BacA-like family transporter, partial [Psittacicella sp.]
VTIYLTVLGVRLNVLFTYWYNNFWGYVQDYKVDLTWLYIWFFIVLAIIYTINQFIIMYLTQGLVIIWTKHLNKQMLGDYFKNKNYYKTQFSRTILENPDQRIQQDITDFTTVSINLFLSFFSNVLSLITFTIVLWNLSKGIEIFGHHIPHGETFACFIFFILTSFWAFIIGKPFIKLTFFQQEYNANYRHSLIKFRKNRESIAFQNGERTEIKKLEKEFDSIMDIAWKLVKRNVYFQGFNFIINQLSVQIPTILLMPLYFAVKGSKAVTIGTIQAVGSAFSQVYTALYWFQSVYGNSSQLSPQGNANVAYGSFAGYKAILQRLSGFYDSINDAENIPCPKINYTNHFSINSLDVYSPEKRLLIRNLNLDLPKAKHLIIRGPSGVGKTTLLRALAGLWPFVDGDISIFRNSIFLPQVPYIPNETLAYSLYYPDKPPVNRDLELEKSILKIVALDSLIPKLESKEFNIDEHWSEKLSLGERQRLAFARVFLKKPDLLFLDEATASLDEGIENTLYTKLFELLPETTIISVAHRSTIVQFHSLELKINSNQNWQLKEVEL